MRSPPQPTSTRGMHMKTRMVLVLLAALPSQLVAQARGATPAAWHLVEEARFGGAEDDAAAFGEIRGVVATRTGKIMVLDYKLHELKLFDAQGKFVKRVARDGAGPGEIRDANGLALGSDGSVWVHDPANGRLSVFDPEGRFIRQIPLPITSYGYLWEGIVENGGRVLDPVSYRTDAAGKRLPGLAVRRLSASTGKGDTIPLPICSGAPPKGSTSLSFKRGDGRGGMMRGIPFQPRLQTVMTRTGSIWCTPSDSYRLLVGKVGGPLKEVVRLEVPPLPVTAAERRIEENRVDSIIKAYGPLESGSIADMPGVKPVIARLIGDDKGRAWVRRTDAKEESPTWDVFDERGRHVAAVRSPGPVGHQVFIDGSTLLTVLTDEYDVPIVVRYRIQERAR